MSPAQCQVARAILKWTIKDLAEKAALPPEAVARIEAGEDLDAATFAQVETAFEDMGIEFTYGERPGVRLRTLDGIIEVSAGLPSKPVKQ